MDGWCPCRYDVGLYITHFSRFASFSEKSHCQKITPQYAPDRHPSMTEKVLKWSLLPFEECLMRCEAFDCFDTTSALPIKADLLGLCNYPCRNDNSRKKASNPSEHLVLNSGDEIQVSSLFVECVSVLAAEFNLDEVITAELLYNAKSLAELRGTSLLDSARIIFYDRLDNILTLIGFATSQARLDSLFSSSEMATIFSNLLASFENLYSYLTRIDEIIEKQKFTSDVNSLQFINGIVYSKSRICSLHEQLGNLLYELINKYPELYATPSRFFEIVAFVNKHIENGDGLAVHFIPGALRSISQLFALVDDKAVGDIHKGIVERLTKEYKKCVQGDSVDVSQSSFKGFDIVVFAFFFTKMAEWCKGVQARESEYEFKSAILKYLEWLVNLDVMEHLLCLAADTCSAQTHAEVLFDKLYDFRSLLQRSYPRLSPLKFVSSSAEEFKNAGETRPGCANVLKLVDTSNYAVSDDFCSLLVAPYLHQFFVDFISNAAIILTLLRDSEEDFLLSSVNRRMMESENGGYVDGPRVAARDSLGSQPEEGALNMVEIASRSELERFYLAFYYSYNNRPQLSAELWGDETRMADFMGFFGWGLSNSSSPLVIATFCLLLTSLMSEGDHFAALKIWDLLSDDLAPYKKKDHSHITFQSIIESLNYYIDALETSLDSEWERKARDSQKRPDFVFSDPSGVKESDPARGKVVIELAEDGVIFISGFTQLLSTLARNLLVKSSEGSAAAENSRPRLVKLTIVRHLMPIVTGYCRFDNLVKGNMVMSQENGVTGAQHSKNIEVPHLVVNNENRVVLINLMMHILRDFIADDDDMELRYNVWRVLDRWIYQAMPSRGEAVSQGLNDDWMYRETQMKLKLIPKKAIRVHEGFKLCMTQLTEVNNFMSLISKLLRPTNNGDVAFRKYHLLYPVDLGYGYRKGNNIGIWPYMEFVMTEVFAKSVQIFEFQERLALQVIILDVIQNSLEDVDWNFLEETESFLQTTDGLDDNIFDSLIPNVPLNHQLFVKTHHSIAALNFLFEEQCDDALFSIIDLGVETSNESQSAAHLISKALKVVKTVLSMQDTFFVRLLPQLLLDRRLPEKSKPVRQASTITVMLAATPETFESKIYYPKELVAAGAVSFFETLAIHLTSVAQFALYVGSPDPEISNTAIDLLGAVAGLTQFGSTRRSGINGELLDGNRLLTAFESIDESRNIKYTFVDVIERRDSDLALKFQILRFLFQCLKQTDGRKPSVAHFLLGYTNKGGYLSYDTHARTLLDSIVACLRSSLDAICEIGYAQDSMLVIQLGATKLCMLALQVLVKLCESPISARITLDMLEKNEGLLEALLKVHPRIDANTMWARTMFNCDLVDAQNNAFIQSPESYQTLLLFIGVRNLTLQFAALTIHGTSSITKRQYYTSLLLETKEFMDGTPKVLNYMDVLNLSLVNSHDDEYEHIKSRYNIPLVMQHVLSKSVDEIDFLILLQVLRANCQTASQSSKEVRVALSNQTIVEANMLRTFLTKVLVSESLRDAQLGGLRSWCQLMRLLLTDVAVSDADVKNLVFGGLQVVLPRLNDAMTSDWEFADEMMSLCVAILMAYDLRVMHASQGDDFELGARKLIPLFKTCIAGTVNSGSPPRLRSDLYVLMNRLVVSAFGRKLVLSQLEEALRLVDLRFVERVASDAAYADGSLRVTAIILLELLVHSAAKSGTSQVMAHMNKSNTFALLIQSTKVTNEMLDLGARDKLGLSLDALLFELTAFRATLCFLTRVALIKAGALLLVQSDLFETLQQCKFLKIDPDMGLLLSIEDESDGRRAKISMVLDSPKMLQNLGGGGRNYGNENVISYFEFLIPIFRLVTTALVSLGPQYQPGIEAARGLFSSQKALIAGIVKRDILMDKKQTHGEAVALEEYPTEGLDTMVDLIALFQALIGGCE